MTASYEQHPPPLEFHRLARASDRYRWWRPLAVGLLAAGLFGSMLLVLFGGLAIWALVDPQLEGAMDASFSESSDHIDLGDPIIFAVAMVSLALILPALLLATRLVGARSVGSLASVVGRIRWRWAARCLLIATALFAVAHVAILLMTTLRGDPVILRPDRSDALALVVLAVLLVPFQAAAEEYLFRGYLMQTLGGWFRRPVLAIVLPVPLFVIGHEYELFGLIDVAVFAVVAGWLTWRTGGLEAAIALHVANNVLLCVLGALGLADINATDARIGELIISLLVTVTFAVVAVRAADRLGIESTAPALPAVTLRA